MGSSLSKNKNYRFNPYKACYEPTDRKIGIHEYIHPNYPDKILDRRESKIYVTTGLPTGGLSSPFISWDNLNKRYKTTLTDYEFDPVNGIILNPKLGKHYSTRYGAVNPVDVGDPYVIKDNNVIRERKRKLYKATLDIVDKDYIDTYLDDNYNDDDEIFSDHRDVSLDQFKDTFETNSTPANVLGGLVLGGATISWNSVLVGIFIVIFIIGCLIIVYGALQSQDIVSGTIKTSTLVSLGIGIPSVILSGLAIYAIR